ncbi:hypothetical protein ALO_21576 [Acetonema longum DSM 6540]|uniref:Toxin SymE-like domain-containing protein n=2 Tax=Acetonema TaxID=2373 RepID=F7NQB3_9FIRM|nr:hypothetical protein ALO_21576 [Acetonema longum DSM 6540]
MVRILTVSGVWSHRNAVGQYVEVPALRLQGKWLAQLGFRVGSLVHVYENPGEITIRLSKEDVSYGKDPF